MLSGAKHLAAQNELRVTSAPSLPSKPAEKPASWYHRAVPERRLPFTVKDDAGASHSGELLIVRTWHPGLDLNPSVAFTIVLVEQPLPEASPPPAIGTVVVCAPATPVRLPATVAETAIAYETGDGSPTPPLRLPRSALAAYAEGALLAALPLSTSAQEVFGAGTQQPRLKPLIDHVLAAARLADACWRNIDQMLSSPRPPARVARPQRLRDRLSAALAELPAAASDAIGEAAIVRLGEIANGAATSVTAMSSSSSIARMARRVGSDRAAKTASRRVSMPAVNPGARQSSTKWLNIAICSITRNRAKSS